ncbi:MAG TPA: glycosyltransferase family 4 protein [Vicinamibacterales bacterium]|nr:glycosyltransferase family 4 protein [Vicinamibacterales bacterium]
MRIAVVEFAGKGGMIHYAYQLCDALSKAGAEVTLLTDRHYELAHLPHRFEADAMLRLWDPKPDGSTRQSPMRRGVRRARRAARALRYYREWVRLIARLRRERPDVVQFGDIRFATDVLPLAALKASGLRLADVCHNVRPFSSRRSAPILRSSALGALLYARLYSRFDLVFAHFDRNRRALQQAFGLDDKRVATIVHGNESVFERLRDPGATPARLRSAIGLEPDRPVLLLFGTLSRYKGVDVMLEAMPRVLAAHPRACLVLAGFPAADFDVEACRSLAADLGVSDSLRVVPRYIASSEVAAWMELAAVAVFPYHTVFQSGALQVALTFGVPIVATRVGAAEDVVRDGENGLLVPPGDRAALAQAITELLSDAPLAARLGRAAAADARGRFAWDSVARTMLEAYRRLPGVAS